MLRSSSQETLTFFVFILQLKYQRSNWEGAIFACWRIGKQQQETPQKRIILKMNFYYHNWCACEAIEWHLETGNKSKKGNFKRGKERKVESRRKQEKKESFLYLCPLDGLTDWRYTVYVFGGGCWQKSVACLFSKPEEPPGQGASLRCFCRLYF